MVGLAAGAALARRSGDGFRVAWLFADPPGEFLNPIRPDIVRMSSVIMWADRSPARAVILLALRLGKRLGPTPFVVIGVLLVCVDLFRAGMGFNPAIDQDVAQSRRGRARSTTSSDNGRLGSRAPSRSLRT